MKHFKSIINLVHALTKLSFALTGLLAIVIKLLDMIINYSSLRMDFISEETSLGTQIRGKA